MIVSKENAKKIAIMQPTFLPWLGYFSLIDYVDEFIFLDHVQFEKRSWQQRNRIRTYGEEIWLSVPVYTKGKQKQSIKDAEIMYEGKRSPLTKIMTSIELNYKKAPFFKDYADDLIILFNQKPEYISNLNENIIRWVCKKLLINTPLVKSSNLNVSGAKADLLVDICNVQNASHYISPPGSKVYIDETDAFELSQIPVSYFYYNHPKYFQLHGDFVPYMCILDLLFNVGPKSANLIKTGGLQEYRA